REMAYRIFDYEIGPAKTIADFENMTVQEFNDIINKMNAAVSMILAHNAEAYAEYQLILQALEAAFRRAADGTPEGAFPDPIFTDNPITSTTGGSHLFTPEFHPFFVNLLIARWNKYLMHQHLSADEMLQKAIGIANRGVLRRPDDSPWQMVSVVGGSNPTFKPNSDGTFTFTTTWDVRADQQQQGHQYQQIIAIDWNRPASQGGGVVSFVWFLEGKYAPGQQINLIFTEDMMRSISGHNFNANGGSGGTIVIKRIAYQENLDEMVLYQLQSLPTTFANIPTASLVLEHSLNDVYLDFPEFGFAGFETEFDDFPDPIPDDEEPAVPEDDDSSTSGGGSGNRITRFSSPPTSPPSIPGEDPPTAPDAPDDPPTIPDAPVSPPADLPPPEAPPTVPDDPGAPPTDPSPPDMPQTGINNSLKLFGIGLLVSLLASIMLGISIAKRQHLK
ncbi:MAG: hypothetical protein FWD03_10495, partial [Defluviitaleaceae bacterium]|nr:hypothetical protein [Defluviitaleaceae bacterium]